MLKRGKSVRSNSTASMGSASIIGGTSKDGGLGGASSGGAERKPQSVKLVLVGQSNVGKSSIVERYVNNQFKELDSTIGAAFMRKELQVSTNFSVRFDIWDTAGEEPMILDPFSRLSRFRSLAPMYYRGAQAALVVYDITNLSTFTAAKSWVKELEKQLPQGVVLTLCGNKTDLSNLREVSSKEAQVYAKEHGMLFSEASARKGTGVNEMFLSIGRELERLVSEGGLVSAHDGSTASLADGGVDLTALPPSQSKCC